MRELNADVEEQNVSIEGGFQCDLYASSDSLEDSINTCIAHRYTSYSVSHMFQAGYSCGLIGITNREPEIWICAVLARYSCCLLIFTTRETQHRCLRASGPLKDCSRAVRPGNSETQLLSCLVTWMVA